MEISHETIARVSLDAYNSLPRNGKPTANEWTILSTIVKSENGKYEVVGLGTGSKCIGASKMSSKGDVLNDSHAEIICRRAFMLYLYEEMLKETSTVLTLNEDKFSINKSVEFHFFTTHTPCGDASIFPKGNEGDVKEEENVGNEIISKKQREGDENSKNCERESENGPSNPKRLCRGVGDIFRTGAKCLPQDVLKDPLEEGSNYHIVGPIRTKPGRGDRTLSVSCTDKLAKWCYMGIQGNLLSILLKHPIYLKSFTITSNNPFNKNALQRGLVDRFKTIELSPPFARKPMLIGVADNKFPFGKNSEDQRPSPCSIICRRSISGMKIEVAVEGRKHGVPKKKLSEPSSLLSVSKLNLFGKFLKVLDKYGLVKEFDRNQTYLHFKKLNVVYNKNWELVKRDSFKVWSEKDESLLNFNFKL